MTPHGHRPDNFPRGIAFSVTSMFLFAVMDAISRVLTHNHGLEVPQILWVRFVIFFVFAVAVIGPRRFLPSFKSAMPKVQLLRGTALIFEIGIFILAFRYLPIADVHAVAAAAPLIVLALSSVLLKERVTLGIWGAVLVGMVGVVIAVRPGMQGFSWFHLLPIAGALSWGFYQTLVRMVGRRDSADTTLAYTVVIGVVLTSAVGPFSWKAPTLMGWVLLLVSGILGALAHMTLIKAYEACSAPRLQPFGYTLVFWAIVVGFVALGEFPDTWTIGGAAIIVAAGIFALLRERHLAARGAPKPDQGR
ncbi:MAG: DMT family transporter [Rhodospirillaceae bacterium]|nr:DMT family transporter [Rhodospirillaceae bacterium]